MKNHKNFYISYILLSLFATILSILLFSGEKAKLSMENLAHINDGMVDYITLQQNSLFLRIGTVVFALLVLVVTLIILHITKKVTHAHMLYNRKSAFVASIMITGFCILLGSLLTNMVYMGYQFAIHLPIIIRANRKV